MKLEKRLPDSHGEIIIRGLEKFKSAAKENGVYIAEIVTQGCVMAFYKLRLVDDTNWISELEEVHSRLTELKLDEGNLEIVLYWGRKIADTVVEFWEENQ